MRMHLSLETITDMLKSDIGCFVNGMAEGGRDESERLVGFFFCWGWRLEVGGRWGLWIGLGFESGFKSGSSGSNGRSGGGFGWELRRGVT